MADKRRHITDQDLSDALDRVNRQDNPNPERRGCPGTPALLAIAEGQPLDDVLLAHLGSCWPCAKELKQLRSPKQQKKSE